MGLMTAVLVGFAVALVAPAMARRARGAAGWLLALPPLGLVLYFGSQLEAIAGGQVVHVHRTWVPALGVNLSFHLDGLSLLFALLICGMGALVLVYAGGYLAGHPQLGRLYALLLVFMASMLGLVLADNVLALFVFWELTSLSSYLLIGFDHERAEARSAALQALLVTAGGGLALLAGLLLLAQAGGSYELTALVGQGDSLRAHALYVPAVLLVLLGAFTKSAQFPFHFWLPRAMEAPTPVSTYLHSATMVKAGVYLLARLSPALGGTDLWVGTVTVIGAATMLIGAWLALVQSDLKRILAYSTVSTLGTLTLLLGVGGTLAVQAAMALLLGHALYKGALFLVAGAVDHTAGTRDVGRLGGLGRAMPWTAVGAVIAALSMAGVPPLVGFIAKELTYESTWHAGPAAWLTGAACATNILLVAVAGVVGVRPFLGRTGSTPRPAHEAPLSMWSGPLVLGALSLAMGVWPAPVADRLVNAGTLAAVGRPADGHLGLWHGLNFVLMLSVLTLAGGVAVYAGRSRLTGAARRWAGASRWGPACWYELALRGLNALASGQTRFLQSGYLRNYLWIILTTLLGLVGTTLLVHGSAFGAADWSNLRFYDVGLVLLIVAAALVAVLLQARLAAIAALGVAGYGVALIFVLYGAPDVAMTQFLIETLTVLLFVLVFYHLPESPCLSTSVTRVRDALLAVAMGALMTALVLGANAVQHHPSISTYFTQHSVPEAHGRNVVNVILVDFRGLDTLGEITVLAIAGVGVYALLKLRPRARETQGMDRQGDSS